MVRVRKAISMKHKAPIANRLWIAYWNYILIAKAYTKLKYKCCKYLRFKEPIENLFSDFSLCKNLVEYFFLAISTVAKVNYILEEKSLVILKNTGERKY